MKRHILADKKYSKVFCAIVVRLFSLGAEWLKGEGAAFGIEASDV